jgi:hypothetical protein
MLRFAANGSNSTAARAIFCDYGNVSGMKIAGDFNGLHSIPISWGFT